MPLTTDRHLFCTICLWFGDDVRAAYRAKAPDKTWHNLCLAHAGQLADKYADAHLVTPAIELNILAGKNPFTGKDYR